MAGQPVFDLFLNLPIVWQISRHFISMEIVGKEEMHLGRYAAAQLNVPAELRIKTQIGLFEKNIEGTILLKKI